MLFTAEPRFPPAGWAIVINRRHNKSLCLLDFQLLNGRLLQHTLVFSQMLQCEHLVEQQGEYEGID